MRKFCPFFLFLRAIVNIPIQTPIISPWLLSRKMIISQLELESPVHAAALVAFFSRIERQFTSENFHTKRKKTLSTTTNLNSPLLTLYFRPDIVWRLLIRPFSYPQICIKFKNMQAWLRRGEKQILSKWSKLPMCDESLSLLPIEAKQSLPELHVCQSYLMLLSRTVYSLVRGIYLAACELHIQHLRFLNQYVNVKTIWRSEVRKFNRSQLTLEVFRGSRLFKNRVYILPLVCSLQSAFYPHAVCTLLPGCSLRSTLVCFLQRFFRLGKESLFLHACSVTIS